MAHASGSAGGGADEELALLHPPQGTEPLTERKAGRYLLRLLRADEAESALRLYEEVGEQVMTRAIWDWRFYSRHPRLQHVIGAFSSEGKLVGLYPCTNRPARVLGRDLMTQHACRTLVHPDHRGGGRLYIAFLRFSFDRLESIGVHFGFGGGAKPAALKMGAWVLGNQEMCALSYFEQRLSWRAALHRRFGRAGALLARPLDLLARRGGSGEPELQTEVLTTASEELDELWRRKRNRYKVLLRRDAREIDWRWLRCPLPSTVLLAHRGDRAEGYAALRHHADAGIRLTTVLDVFTGREESVAAALLAAAADQARAAGSDFLQMAPKEGSTCHALAAEPPWKPSRRPADHVIVGHTSHHPEQVGLAEHVATATDGHNWHYCLGDSDFFD